MKIEAVNEDGTKTAQEKFARSVAAFRLKHAVKILALPHELNRAERRAEMAKKVPR